MKEKLKKSRCPKCGGNMYREKDYYADGSFFSWYVHENCLQCGFSNDSGQRAPLTTGKRKTGTLPVTS